MSPESSYCLMAFLNTSMFLSLWPSSLPKDVRFVKLKTWLGFGVLKWQDLQKKRNTLFCACSSSNTLGASSLTGVYKSSRNVELLHTALKILIRTKPRHFQLKLSFTFLLLLSERFKVTVEENNSIYIRGCYHQLLETEDVGKLGNCWLQKTAMLG